MLHLLNNSQKNKVLKEYRMRLFVVVCIFIIFVSLAGVALLIPSYLTAVGKINLIKNDNQLKVDSIKAIKDKNFEDKIKKVNDSLNALKVSINIISPREAYDKILNSTPAGVSVVRYTYNLVDDNTASISISGTSQNRDMLAEFQNRLKLNPEFKGITVPLSDFAKKKDLDFTLNFNLVRVVNK